MIYLHNERSRCQGDRGIPEPAHFAGEDMPRKPLDVRLTDYPVTKGKDCVLFLPPARTGAGRARKRGQGAGPLQVLRAAP